MRFEVTTIARYGDLDQRTIMLVCSDFYTFREMLYQMENDGRRVIDYKILEGDGNEK